MDASNYNYYDVLEVSSHSPQQEITTAYERAKLTYSGDNPAIYTIFSEDEARDLLRLVEEAYSVIGNKTLRALYDEKMSGANGKHISESVSFENLKTASQTPKLEIAKKTPTKTEYNVDAAFEQTISAQQEWTGTFLKQVREYKNYSVESMSAITKISNYYIRAVENTDPKSLPAAVFVRGYVAQICKILALDEKRVCDSYMKLFKEVSDSK